MMKKSFRSGTAFLCLVGCSFLNFSCNDPAAEEVEVNREEIPESIIQKLTELHFDTSDIMRHGDDYLVEGDMIFSPEQIDQLYEDRIVNAKDEQYYTCNTGIASSGTITVRGYGLNSTMSTGLDWAIANYNRINLTIQLVRVNGSADITVYSSGSGAGGVAGFPSGGNPYPYVNVYPGTASYGTNVVEHVMAHEIGHCLGLRHTDWFNRAYSCSSGGSEGTGSYGACNIPGTPTGVDPNSIMLSCFSASEDGEFSNYDIIGLQWLY